MPSFTVPELLGRTAQWQPEVAAWLDDLPRIIGDLADRWSLRLGEPFQPGGFCSWTAPATGLAGGEDLVVKVGYPFSSGEQRDEAAALRAWDGDGAVRLRAELSTASAHALLLERCVPGSCLRGALPGPEVDAVIAALLRRLWNRAGAARAKATADGAWPFRPLTQMCDEWADEFEREHAAAPPQDRLDPGLARAGIALLRELPRTATESVLLCTDLHYENVLAARREPWLVIDPKPYVGDPAYDLLQHIINRVHSDGADAGAMCDRMAGLTGVDPGRARLWLFARAVRESSHPIFAARLRQVAAELAPA